MRSSSSCSAAKSRTKRSRREQSSELQEGRLQNRGQRDLARGDDRDEPGREAISRRRTRRRAHRRARRRRRAAARLRARPLYPARAGDAQPARPVAPAHRRPPARPLAATCPTRRQIAARRCWRTCFTASPACVGTHEVTAAARCSPKKRFASTPRPACACRDGLQRAAGSGDPDARTRAVAAAAKAAAEEATRTHADAAWDAITPAPRLAGAFAEASLG